MPRSLDRRLIRAAIEGNWGELRRAVRAGADVNARDSRGMTVLMHAVARGDDLEAVRYLVEQGADVRASDLSGRTVLDHLTYPPKPPEEWENEHEAWTHSEQSYIHGYLKDAGAQHTALAEWAQERDALPTAPPLEAEVLPAIPAKTATQKASGIDWALFAAIQRGAVADVESILATDKVNVDARDDGGWTPLMRAVSGNHVEIARLLLEGGADPTVQAAKGLTAWLLAGPEARATLEEFARAASP